MRAGERGFLLLTSQLGDPQRKPLSVAQMRNLAMRVTYAQKPVELRDLTEEDFVCLGYDRRSAARMIQLLSQERLLEKYIALGKKYGCIPISRVSNGYPQAVRQRLGLDAPGCLWAKGDMSLLDTAKIALVGSRDLREENRLFAKQVGREAAKQGVTLVSGNARGADRTAQNSCLEAGGQIIVVVADELQKYPVCKNVLYLSEDSFDLPFSPQRALSRNRVIHTIGSMTLVAQCTMESGGTWHGTTKNLQNNWTPVYCFDDQTPCTAELEQRGATRIRIEQLFDLSALCTNINSFYNQ